MKLLTAKRGFTFVLLLSCIFCKETYSQQIIFSDSLGNFTDIRYCGIVGKIKNTFITIEALPDNPPHVLLFDTGCVLRKEYELSFIPAGGFIRAGLLPDQQGWSILWQTARGNNWYLYHTTFDENARLTDGTVPIDSLEIPKNTRRHPFYVTSSPFNHYQLLYRKIADTANNQMNIDLSIVPPPGGHVAKGKMVVPFNREFDETGEISIDESGTVYTTVYDHPQNFRYGATINLYQYSATGGQVNYPPLLSKGKKPVNIRVLPESAEHSILLMALYTDFYSKNIDGILSASVSTDGSVKDSLYFYTFSKEEKKELNKHIAGISRDKLMNYLELKECHATTDKKISLLLQLSHNAYGNTSNSFSPAVNRNRGPGNNNNGFVQSPVLVSQRSGAYRRGTRMGSVAGGYDPYSPATQLLTPNYASDFTQNNQGIPVSNPSTFGNPNIPVAYVSFIASFDDHFNLLNKKVLQTQVTSEEDYIAPYITIKNGLCSRFNYEGSAAKPRLKKTEVSMASAEIRENVHQMRNPFLLLLDHPSLYMDNAFLLTFYHNKISDSYGLAKYSW